MATSGRILSAVAVGLLLAGCNQSQQTRLFDGEGAELSQIRQWQTEAALLPAEERGRYMADRMARLLPDDTLNACPPWR